MDWTEGEVLTAEDGVHGRSSKRHSHGGMADVKASFSHPSPPFSLDVYQNRFTFVLIFLYMSQVLKSYVSRAL